MNGTSTTSSCTDREMNEETINYRLGIIESTLAEMKDLLTQSKVQQEKVAQLEDHQKETDSKLIDIANKIDKVSCQVSELRLQPIKEKSKKWEYIFDYGFKLIVGGAFAGLMVKLGINL